MQPRWLACLAFGCLAACGSPQSPTLASDGTPPSDWFTDQAQAVGLAFRHVNGMTGELTLVEIMGAGVGLFDYDNDGDLDVYAVQGGRLPGGGGAGGDRLYRNDLTIAPDGTRALRFTDVTEEAGIDVQSYGMGVAAGDIDNDGWVDLYLTRFGPDVLLHNNGNGTFSDITRQAGIADSAWSVPASFLDFDRDGWLDLYVGHYVRYDVTRDIDCRGPTGTADYCTPQAYRPVAGRLYRNQRNRTFADVTLGLGIAGEYGPALGSIAADVDGDRWVDLYVANDGTPNQLWLNQRGARFRNGALLAGVAVSGEGRPEGSMGVDAGDFDEDGDEDLIVTNLFGEGTVLYVNDGAGVFEDQGAASGLRPASRRLTGFGVAWIDADNDGWLDVFSVNGAVQRAQPFATPGDPFPLGQPMQLLRNRGDGRFEDVTAQAGRAFGISAVSRGAAFGDVDNDGDADVVVSTNNGPLRLLVNQRGHRKHWIGLRLVAASGRDALGARVAIVMPDGMTRWRRVRSDGSYASANDPRVLVGLGDSKVIPRLRIEWPDGRIEERMLDGIDRWVTIRERQ